MAESQTASVTFSTLQRYCEQKHGAGAFERVRTVMRERGLELDHVFPPDTWYPTTTFLVALEAAHDTLGPANFYEVYGEYGAVQMVNVLFRFVLRFTSPTFFLHRAASMWGRVHTTGVWTVESAPKRLRGTLRDFGVVHAGYCRVIASWLRRASQMTGVRGAGVQHPHCRALGAEACVFEGEWR